MRIVKVLSVVGMLSVWLTPAHAQPGPYVGATYGQYDIEENAINETDTLWKAFIGTQVSEWFAVEAAFVNLDRAREQNSSFEADGWSAAGVLSVPLGPHSGLYAKAGGYWWDAQSSFAVIERDEDGNDPFWGAGLRFAVGGPFSARVEYERYEVVDTDLDTVSVGLQANF